VELETEDTVFLQASRHSGSITAPLQFFLPIYKVITRQVALELGRVRFTSQIEVKNVKGKGILTSLGATPFPFLLKHRHVPSTQVTSLPLHLIGAAMQMSTDKHLL